MLKLRTLLLFGTLPFLYFIYQLIHISPILSVDDIFLFESYRRHGLSTIFQPILFNTNYVRPLSIFSINGIYVILELFIESDSLFYFNKLIGSILLFSFFNYLLTRFEFSLLLTYQIIKNNRLYFYSFFIFNHILLIHPAFIESIQWLNGRCEILLLIGLMIFINQNIFPFSTIPLRTSFIYLTSISILLLSKEDGFFISLLSLPFIYVSLKPYKKILILFFTIFFLLLTYFVGSHYYYLDNFSGTLKESNHVYVFISNLLTGSYSGFFQVEWLKVTAAAFFTTILTPFTSYTPLFYYLKSSYDYYLAAINLILLIFLFIIAYRFDQYKFKKIILFLALIFVIKFTLHIYHSSYFHTATSPMILYRYAWRYAQIPLLITYLLFLFFFINMLNKISIKMKPILQASFLAYCLLLINFSHHLFFVYHDNFTYWFTQFERTIQNNKLQQLNASSWDTYFLLIPINQVVDNIYKEPDETIKLKKLNQLNAYYNHPEYREIFLTIFNESKAIPFNPFCPILYYINDQSDSDQFTEQISAFDKKYNCTYLLKKILNLNLQKNRLIKTDQQTSN